MSGLKLKSTKQLIEEWSWSALEFHVVVALPKVEEKTAGGVWMPEQVVDRDEIAQEEGVIVDLSPVAFTYETWPEGTQLPSIGDSAIFPRYAGMLVEDNGNRYRVIKDKDIACWKATAVELEAAA